jgi:hypothetical protein
MCRTPMLHASNFIFVSSITSRYLKPSLMLSTPYFTSHMDSGAFGESKDRDRDYVDSIIGERGSGSRRRGSGSDREGSRRSSDNRERDVLEELDQSV